MHISSLPNELLVNIFGRLDFDSVGSVLFLNKKINNLVNVHHLYRPIIDQLTVYYVSILSRREHYTFIVNARIIPKLCQKDGMKSQTRKQIEHLKVLKSNKDQIAGMLTEMLKKFQIYQVKHLEINYRRAFDFDIMDVIQTAGISVEILETININLYTDARCVTKKILDKLVLLEKTANRDKPLNINFNKCSTGICFQNLLNHINQHFENMGENCHWNFGVLNMSVEESNQIKELVNKINQRIPVSYSRRVHGRTDEHYLRNDEREASIKWLN